MNEHTPAAESTVPSEPEKMSVLRLVLFAVLGVMIVALIYEYGLVRRSYRAAENAVDDLIERRHDVETPITPEVVQARIGKAPVGGLQDKGDYFLHHYQWTRWLPWKTYDIYVVYDHGEPPTLYNTTRPDPPALGDTPYAGFAYQPPEGAGENEIIPAAFTPGASAPESVGGPGRPDAAQRRRPAAEDDDGQESANAPAEASAEAQPSAESAPAEADQPQENKDDVGEPAAAPDAGQGESSDPDPEPESPVDENE